MGSPLSFRGAPTSAFTRVFDALCAASGMTAETYSANAPLSRGFVFGRPGAPVSLFSLSPRIEGMERREAPGGLRDLLRLVCETNLRAELPGPKASQGVGVPGRAGPCEGPGASRRSIAARVVGGRILLRAQTSRSTTPSTQQDRGNDYTDCKYKSRTK